MKLGAERKKLAILIGLLVVAVVVFFTNSGNSGGPPQSATVTPSRPSPAVAEPPTRVRRPADQRQSLEFRPSLLKKRGEAPVDPTTVDPALRLDALAKLQAFGVEGTHRNIFEFGQAPPPKIDPVKAAAAKVKVPSPLASATPVTPIEQVPAKPQAPPVPLKFYGFISPSGAPSKRAFFMEGDEIHVATEGETIKRRYKIVRIGINSAVVEDTQFGSQQTLPLEEQPG